MLIGKSIDQIHQAYKDKEISPTELTRMHLNRIAMVNPGLNAYLTITEEKAFLHAQSAESLFAAGSPTTALTGIPVSYKDLFDSSGIRTTYGSAHFREHVPAVNAKALHQFTKAGAVMTGKTNLHEYAFGITSNNPHYGAVRNPWNHIYIAGGSSGGSAAATAAGLSLVSLGTDTGGSIRIPASMCGVIGLKPTFGLLSTEGVMPLSWHLDHVGPIARTVSDAAIALEVLLSKTIPEWRSQDLRGIRIGIPTNYFNHQVSAEVAEKYQSAIAQFQDLGAVLLDVEVPFDETLVPALMTIAVAEAGYVHRNRIETALDLFGDDVRQALAGASEISASSYIAALRKQEDIKNRFNQLFDGVDLIITPTLPALPQRIGASQLELNGEQQDLFQTMTRFTSPLNATGNPALSLPCGVSESGLPVGIQLIGRWHGEGRVLQAARAYEEAALSRFYKLRDAVCLL